MQEATTDCSAEQVQASKRFHEREHHHDFHELKILLVGGGGGGTRPKRPIKIGLNDPP